MEEMFKLSRRAGSAKWQVRKRWPTDVASFLKGEFNRSTGEGDRKAAQAQLPFLAAARELAVEIEAVRAAGATSLREIAQRLNERHVILTSNRGFAEWGDIFGSPVVATALLDRLLHHAIVIQIDGSSYRLRRHADLLPEHIRSNALITPPAPVEPRRRGRPPKNGGAAQTT
jgi:hypothetical protein